jgi:hypothetical protein
MGTDNVSNGAVGWDPKSPATLLVPAIVNNSDDDDDDNNDDNNNNNSGQNVIINYMLTDNGVGCNTFESSAIMNLLDARDDYFEMKSSSSTNIGGGQQAIRQLSKQYRKALASCINDWSYDVSKKEEDEQQQDQQQQQKVDKISLELLRMTYAVTQLSETFLLLPSTMQEDGGISNIRGSTYYEDTMNLPGAVTADTVRYLRTHQLGDAEDQFDEYVIKELYNIWQPDQHNGNGEDYWKLIEAYIIRGCLEDAWATLSHHSIVRRFTEMENQEDDDNVLDDYQAASLVEDREGFQALRSVLLSAPIPGARNNFSDTGFDDNNDTAEGNDQNSSDGQNTDDDNVLNTSVVEEESIDGVPTSAYCLWETSRNGRRTGDYPVNFEPHAAYQVYQTWKQSIDTIPALQRLRRRIPQLNKLLGLLSGNFRDIEFGSWQEELCAELLYKIPNIQLVDMNVRAASLMKKYNNNNDTAQAQTDNIILTIMKGNAGQVIKVMHEFGGGSGAALPAIMVSVYII